MSRKNKASSQAGLNDRLGSFDLEPPKIYRDSSNGKNPSERSTKKAKNKVELRRRQDKKRKLKKRVRNTLAGILVVLLLAGVGIILSLTVFFKIDAITPGGSGIYSSDEIIAVSGIEIEQNLFLIDTEEIAANIESALPWAYSVKVERSLPGEVKITVTDATAAYAIKNEDKTYIVLDDNFKVLETASEKRPSATVLIACDTVAKADAGYKIEFENDEISQALSSLAAAIKSTSFTEATKIKSNGAGDNYIVYDSRITFKLGSVDDLEEKIYRGLAVCEKLNESNPGAKGTLDLRYDKESYFTSK
ncbi:MAG: FtsQ-type POTRA domain-containing protein [Clostridiales bacterium]|nr:FtsQ-type POTRA domain-containing protein [Clostridiales bacterium]